MGFWDWIKGKNNEAEASDLDNANSAESDFKGFNLDEVNLDAFNKSEAAVEEATIEETAVEEATIEEATIEETTIEKTLVEEAAVEESTIEEASIKETTTEDVSEKDSNIEASILNEQVSEAEFSDEHESEEKSEEEPETKVGLFARLKAGLTKTRDNIVSGMDSLFNSDEKINEDFYDELEETLILGDIGVHTTEDILDRLKAAVKSEHIKKRSDCKEFLIKTLKEIMDQGETAYKFEQVPSVVFVIGVNGVGKTTSIGKLASHIKGMNKRVMMAACDTFRAAAGSQLEEWSHRAGVELIGGVEGQDPSSVLFDAVNAAVARNVDVLLVDTAGRLHNKKNLMDELKKMNKIIDKVCGDSLNRENLIVLDASTGQNALNQAKEFGEVADLTGIILTKMDGTAKGGIAIAIQSELGIPVKYIGVGEKISDLQKFDSDSFVDALFDVDLTDDNNENDSESNVSEDNE